VPVGPATGSTLVRRSSHAAFAGGGGHVVHGDRAADALLSLGRRGRAQRLPIRPGAAFLSGRLDEAPVYDRMLTPEDVVIHWGASF
jgi:hypothetical protein